MKVFTENLRQRVAALNISLAEAARRANLGDRRFANYAAGTRQPDLATLVRIAASLDTSPDKLLGVEPEPASDDERAKLRQQLAADARVLDASSLRLAIDLVRTVVSHQPRPKRRRR